MGIKKSKLKNTLQKPKTKWETAAPQRTKENTNQSKNPPKSHSKPTRRKPPPKNLKNPREKFSSPKISKSPKPKIKKEENLRPSRREENTSRGDSIEIKKGNRRTLASDSQPKASGSKISIRWKAIVT